MTCRDMSGLVPLFFDGELDARQMRALALHSSRCASCEEELRHIESLQELVATTIAARVDELDLSGVWTAVEARLSPIRASAWQRVRLWWEERDPVWWVRVPVAGAVFATAAVAFVLWSGQVADEPQQLAQQPVAAAEDAATIDWVDSNAESVTVLNEPDTNTTVLWVNDDTDYGGEGFPP